MRPRDRLLKRKRPNVKPLERRRRPKSKPSKSSSPRKMANLQPTKTAGHRSSRTRWRLECERFQLVCQPRKGGSRLPRKWMGRQQRSVSQGLKSFVPRQSKNEC